VLFECISAYGTVGLSLGYPHTLTSFSAKFSNFSKLMVVVIMVLGRNRFGLLSLRIFLSFAMFFSLTFIAYRGLPDSLDRAVAAPFDLAKEKDRRAEQHRWFGLTTVHF
jgi:hypothetical protein